MTLISVSDTFTFLPSLIWVAQGWRELDEITFSIRPTLEEAGIEFIQARLEQIDPQDKALTLSTGESAEARSGLAYDKLLIATGGEWAFILLGVIAVVIMLFAPQGVWGLLRRRFDLELFPVRRRFPPRFLKEQ